MNEIKEITWKMNDSPEWNKAQIGMDLGLPSVTPEQFKEILLGRANYRPFPKDHWLIPILNKDQFELIETETCIEVWDKDAWYIQAQVKAKHEMERLENQNLARMEVETLRPKLESLKAMLGDSDSVKTMLEIGTIKGLKNFGIDVNEARKILNYINKGELSL